MVSPQQTGCENCGLVVFSGSVRIAMSRVGKKPIPIPSGVKVVIEKDHVWVEGPKGRLKTPVPQGIRVEVADGILSAHRERETRTLRALHGLTRTLVANSVIGVTQGFQKELDVVGIGFRAETQEKSLTLTLGFSHLVEFSIPEGIRVEVERSTKSIRNYAVTIVVRGIDKCQVGQVSADIRSLRPPDTYKGRGIRYADEVVGLKVGKKGA